MEAHLQRHAPTAASQHAHPPHPHRGCRYGPPPSSPRPKLPPARSSAPTTPTIYGRWNSPLSRQADRHDNPNAFLPLRPKRNDSSPRQRLKALAAPARTNRAHQRTCGVKATSPRPQRQTTPTERAAWIQTDSLLPFPQRQCASKLLEREFGLPQAAPARLTHPLRIPRQCPALALNLLQRQGKGQPPLAASEAGAPSHATKTTPPRSCLCTSATTAATKRSDETPAVSDRSRRPSASKP